MEQAYKTIAAQAQDEFTEQRSRFIGYVRPVSTEEEAQRFIEEKKKFHWDAKHNVYAYVLRGGIQRCSDDGEPHGTAGVPTLDVLLKSGVTDAVVVVTRYFGGILLGKGGLVRAYTDSAAEAVKASGLVSVTEGEIYSISMGYDMSEKLIYALTQAGWCVKDPEYGECVKVGVVCPAVKGEKLQAFVKDRSFGRAEAVKEGTDLIRTELTED